MSSTVLRPNWGGGGVEAGRGVAPGGDLTETLYISNAVGTSGYALTRWEERQKMEGC